MTSVFAIIIVAAQIGALYLLADLITGAFHWAEDTLGTEDTWLWGPLFVRPNIRHHEDPQFMNTIPWYINNLPIVGGVATFLLATALLGGLSWQAWVLALFVGITQQVHRFQHRPTVRLPRPVLRLMRLGLFQNARHHWRHHTAPHTSCYCVLTPWLNPALDRIGFWRGLERILAPVFGAPRRPDIVARPWYPARPLLHRPLPWPRG